MYMEFALLYAVLKLRGYQPPNKVHYHRKRSVQSLSALRAVILKAALKANFKLTKFIIFFFILAGHQISRFSI